MLKVFIKIKDFDSEEFQDRKIPAGCYLKEYEVISESKNEICFSLPVSEIEKNQKTDFHIAQVMGFKAVARFIPKTLTKKLFKYV